MRDAVEKAIGDAVANELLTGGDGCGKLSVVESGERLGVTRREMPDAVGRICTKLFRQRLNYTPTWVEPLAAGMTT